MEGLSGRVWNSFSFAFRGISFPFLITFDSFTEKVLFLASPLEADSEGAGASAGVAAYFLLSGCFFLFLLASSKNLRPILYLSALLG